MPFLSALRRPIRGFHRDEAGAMPIEGLIAFIFLVWWYIASFQFFDAYRQKNINLKAAYTVADMLSRETGPVPGDPNGVEIDITYIRGLNRMFDYLTNSKHPTWIRVSSIYWDETDSKYRVDWSVASQDTRATLTTPMLQAASDRIPVLRNGDTLVVVETFMAYEPLWYYKGTPEYSVVDGQIIEVLRPYDSGLEPQWMSTFITTAPRFASCLPWESSGCGTDTNGNWVNPDMTDPEEDDDPDA
jgi:hypothetical protein